MFIHSSSPRITPMEVRKPYFSPNAEKTRRAFLQELERRMKGQPCEVVDLKGLDVEIKKHPMDDNFRARKALKITMNGKEHIFKSQREAADFLFMLGPTLSAWVKAGHNPEKTIFVEIVGDKAWKLKPLELEINGETRVFNSGIEAAKYMGVRKETFGKWRKAGGSPKRGLIIRELKP